MRIENIVNDLCGKNNIANTLDIGGGTGYNALISASYGSKVDIVEPNKMKGFMLPDFLKQHPKIIWHNMTIQKFQWEKLYDLIICVNVIMFIDREYVINKLFPKINKYLNPGGYFICVFFDKKDTTIQNSNYYDIKDFTKLSNCKIIAHHFAEKKEDHKPIGPHIHYIHTLIFQKNP